MKTLSMKERNRNSRRRTYSKRERCRWCADTGFVVVQTRQDPYPRRHLEDGQAVVKTTVATIEEMGPCPYCEQGYYEEFGGDNPSVIGTPWGKDGFWRGRDQGDLEPMEQSGEQQLSKEENLRRLRELTASIELRSIDP